MDKGLTGKTKKQIRAAALSRRDGLPAKEREVYSRLISEKLTALPCYRQAQAVLTYVSFRSEVDTGFLLEQALEDRKAVFAPRVSGREMEFFRIAAASDLAEGYHGILEPAGGISYIDWISQIRKTEQPYTLICLPGAAFDRKRHRIGYGGGFYDRYLGRLRADNEEGLPRIVMAALAFSCQVLKEIPWESHDICPDCIVTETEVI